MIGGDVPILYAQIESNKRKTYFIVTSFILFVLLVGGVVTFVRFDSFWSGTIISAIFCAVYIPIVIFNNKAIIMKMNHAKKINSRQENIFIWSTVENLAMVARIPMPEIYIIYDSSPNAFATGMSPKNSAVAITTGLLEVLNKEEIEGVLAHEIAHIKGHDIKVSTMALALVSIVVFLSDIGTRFFFSSGDRKVPPYVYILLILFIILSPIIATLIQLSVSRNREYLADANGAELCRNPRALASALHKIAKYDEPVREASKSSANLYISDPFKKEKTSWFSTHPPTSERIKRLLKM